MRIISGKFKGRRFRAPSNIPTRPTTDTAKEGLFNILNNYYNFDRVSFLDLFMGTGAISYEFASRGCTDITSVDLFPACVKFAKKMTDDLQIEGMQVIQADVLQFIKFSQRQYDIIFAGPPYPMEEIPLLPDMVLENNMLTDVGWFILEHSPDHDFTDHPNLEQIRMYGKTTFSIFTKTKISED
ncbi:MAG: methyltransferase domain-containing protein [Chitinophagaceae bacterium]|nr:MAG: methyltransferase domain-containing protein [Chitinophagaceae bacterium]